MNTVEEAYQEIARSLIWFVADEDWDFSRATSSIWISSTQTSLLRSLNGNEVRDNKFPPMEMMVSCTDALLYLRDNLLQTTGQRIWGLTFTLWPNGKFKIEYDYDKPEGYEESDEVITGDEINASLQKLTGQDGSAS